MIVVADTSGLLAAFDEAQPEHDLARPIMDLPLLISPLVLTDLDHLVQRQAGFLAALDVVAALEQRLLDGLYRLGSIQVADLGRAHEVRTRYASLELDLADAVGMILADRHGTTTIFTLDQRDFRAVRPLTEGHDHYTILPYDQVDENSRP